MPYVRSLAQGAFFVFYHYDKMITTSSESYDPLRRLISYASTDFCPLVFLDVPGVRTVTVGKKQEVVLQRVIMTPKFVPRAE